MSAHIQQMPHWRRHCESQPHPEAEAVRAYPRAYIRPRPHFPRTPTAQDYEESPRPAMATSPHDPIRPTHAHSSAQSHGPAQGQWWQHWTDTQLWELRKWAWAGPSLEGLVHRPRKGSAENRRLQPAGGRGWHRPHGKPCWPMRSTPRESTPATPPRPRTTRMSSGACGRPSRRRNEKADARGTSPQAQAHAHTPPRHPTAVDAPTPAAPAAPQEPCAPHSTMRLTHQPATPPPNPDTQLATAAGRHAEPHPEDTKQTRRRRTPTRTPTGTATPNGAEPKPAAVQNA